MSRLSLTLVLFCSAIVGCGRSTLSRLTEGTAYPDVEVLRHVVNDDDGAFASFCADAGQIRLSCAARDLLASLPDDSPRRWADRLEFISPYVERIAVRLAEDYSETLTLRRFDGFRSRSPEEALHALHVRTSIQAAARDTIAVEQRIERVEQQLAIAERDSLDVAILTAVHQLYELLGELGRWDEVQLSYVQRAIELSRDLGDAQSLCQHLGYLAFLHHRRGEEAQRLACLREALDVAVRCRLSTQAPRLAMFLSEYYEAIGRYELASEFRERSLEYCRDFHAGSDGLRFVLDAIEDYASVGCWNVASEHLPLAELLSTQPPYVVSDTYYWFARLQLMRARFEARAGQTEAACKRMEPFCRDSWSPPRPHHELVLLADWASTLLDAGLDAKALELVDKELERARQLSNQRMITEFLRMRAQALIALGHLDDAEQTLQELEAELSRVGSDAWPRFECELLQARLHLAAGRKEAAGEHLKTAFDRLLLLLGRSDGSAESYLFGERTLVLIDILQQTVGADPLRTQQLELARRELRARPATFRTGVVTASVTPSSAPGIIPAPLLEHGEAAQHRLLEWAARTNGIHLLFEVHGDEVIRWTTTRDGVTRDVLAQSSTLLRTDVVQALGLLSTDPGRSEAPMAPELRGLLASLSTNLLPDLLLDSTDDGQERPLLVTADGFLRGLPFAVLSSRASEYLPLCLSFDVGTLRSVRELTWTRRGHGLIAADPELSPDLLRRYPDLRQLRNGMLEAQHVQDVYGEACVLTGKDFTRDALFRGWENAGFLYFASHLVRNPENPYLTFLPVSTDPSKPMGQDRIGVVDIRRADLSRCELVVLSACSSGIPPVVSEDNASAPSIADSFLDAGAHAVIETFWNVRDEFAREFMGRVIDAWASGEPPLTALATVRRSLILGAEDIPHPFSWGVYGLDAGGL